LAAVGLEPFTFRMRNGALSAWPRYSVHPLTIQNVVKVQIIAEL
jgi:hypothetical protein